MKSDIDRLMEAQNVDALLITGAAQHNPMMTYFTGIGHVSDGDLIKKRGSDPVLFCNPMEREEAARTGLKTISYSKFPMRELLAETGGNQQDAFVLRYKKMFTELGITSGTVAVYGLKEVGIYYSVLTRLQQMMPELSFTGFMRDEILSGAMMTKDYDEIEHIRQMGRITVNVVGKTAEFLTSHSTKKGLLVKKDGTPLLLGEVKRNINLWLAEYGVENPEGTIFAIGHDAGVPHSTGNPQDAMRLGQTIVYDIYPAEAGGGYFYDFTRTWCLGYASDEILKLYEDVKTVYDKLVSELKVNEPFFHYQNLTCDLFEKMGHPTIQGTPSTDVGYVHSIGHGIGLYVHEKPWSTAINPSPSDVLVPGSIFTLEPGLYYPEKGIGVRIEDSYACTAEGQFEVLVDYPKDLILPVKG